MRLEHGLPEKTVSKCCEALAQFPAVESAVLFGSRAKGTHRHGSDIDLALTGPGLDWRTLGRIDDALDDLLLPYRFSLVLADERLDASVAAHISRVGLPFYEKYPGRIRNPETANAR